MRKLFRDLSEPLLSALADKAIVKTLSRDEILFVMGDGPWRLGLLEYKGRKAPKGVFDAVPDGPGWALAATGSGLIRFRLNDGQSERIPAPNKTERFTALARDKAGWLWTAGNQIYVSKNEGKSWSPVDLPMLTTNQGDILKKLKPNPASLHGMWIALGDRGIVAIE